MSETVQQILRSIQQLPEEDRRMLTERLAQLADAAGKLEEEQARGQDQPSRTQAEMLADLRRRSYTPPPGTPESVDLLRQDRER